MVDESIEAATASERQLLEMTDQIKSLEVYEPWPTEDAVNPTIEEGEEGEEVEDDAMSDHPRKLLLMSYFRKFLGVENKHPPPINGVLHSVLSSILAFTGILLVAVTDYWFLSRSFESEDHSAVAMLTGAQAATAVLLYEAYQAPLSQPRNVFGSYTVCSIVGVTVRIVAGDTIGIQKWIVGALAVAFAIGAMNLTKTIHPPGGACALIAVIGGDTIHNLGYGYVLTSMGAAAVMISVALIGNNLIYNRQYPLYWN